MFKGITRVVNSVASIFEGSAELVNSSVTMANDKIRNQTELGDLAHAEELIESANKVTTEQLADSFAKLKAIREARASI